MAKGSCPKPIRIGPQPGRRTAGRPSANTSPACSRAPSASSTCRPREKFDASRLRQCYTAQTLSLQPAHAPNASIAARSSAAPQDNPIPRKLGEPTPIKYCIYIIKENRTYDQVLGDMPQGNGDPTLCLFPERITPNHHQLAREFVLLDNFYVESEVSADGHEWTMGAYATDFVEKMWPLSYGHNKHKKFPYPAEGNFAIATPAGG